MKLAPPFTANVLPNLRVAEPLSPVKVIPPSSFPFNVVMSLVLVVTLPVNVVIALLFLVIFAAFVAISCFTVYN